MAASQTNPDLPCVYNTDLTCSPFSLVNDQDSNLINNNVAEAINIAGAEVNVFKLLGIYEQTKLIDLTSQGVAISSGEYTAFPASNAFDDTTSEWRSIQKGQNIPGTSFIGYDFGPIRLNNGRVRYGIDTAIKQHITTIKIKQSCNEENRISKARVERSTDNKIWYGVDIIDLPNSGETIQLRIKQSAPARYWRIRALSFNGGVNDLWAVVNLELYDFNSVILSDVQDELGFLENRDRSYATQTISLKAYYELIDPTLELTRFAAQMPDSQTWIFKVAFSTAINTLGRPFVIGDILEIPSQIQYTPTLKPVKKYLEVTDVAWATDGYTPGWTPTLQRLTAQPAIASQETMAIFGDLNLPSNKNDYAHLEQKRFNIEALFLDQKVIANANTKVPERGEDIANIRQFTNEEIAEADHQKPGINLGKLNINPTTHYVEAAMPPNGEPFTEGPTFPQNPKNGDWHRLTYENVPDPIPTVLYRFSVTKGRWLIMEQDRRKEYTVTTNPRLESYISDPNAVPLDQVGR